MNEFDFEMLADAWINYTADSKNNKDKFYAWEAINDLVFNNPEQAWIVILKLIEKSPSDFILANIAAGPLEDLIRHNFEKCIPKVEEQARKNIKFRRCLSGVWCGTDVPGHYRKIIEKYTKTVENPL